MKPIRYSLLVPLLGSVACTLLVNADEQQCEVDGDCATRGLTNTQCVGGLCRTVGIVGDAGGELDAEVGPPLDPKWGCIGNVKWGQQDVAQRIVNRVRFVRLIGETPVDGIAIRACGRLDPSCSTPLGAATTDSEGYANIEIPKFFEGFYDLPPPASYPNMAPSLITVVPPPDKSSDLAQQIPTPLTPHLASLDELNFIAAQLGATTDPELGHLLGIVLDCQGQPSAGVSLRISIKDKKTVPYYTDTTGLQTSTAEATAPRGEAGFINVPTGAITIETTLLEQNKRVGTYTTIIQKGHITYLPMPPSP